MKRNPMLDRVEIMYLSVRYIIDREDRKSARQAALHLKSKILRNIDIREEVFLKKISISKVGKSYGISRSRIYYIIGREIKRIRLSYIRFVKDSDKKKGVVRSSDRILYGSGGPYEGLRDLDEEERIKREALERAALEGYNGSVARSSEPVDISVYPIDWW